MTRPLRVSVLGATGSVGTSTLELMAETQASGAAAYQVVALVGGQNVERLAEQARQWRPELTVIADPACGPALTKALSGTGLRTGSGPEAVREAAVASADWVMAAIVGTAGLEPTWLAAGTGAVIALANKESLVCCGPALMAHARASGGRIIPVDSEHSAIFQVWQPDCAHRVARIVLTASGGPFRSWTRAAMQAATPEQAVAHPNWSMGAKISVDSASMANKGLELIEAAYLFGLSEDRIGVVIHPQSIIHSLVEYQDGSTLAQMGPPDMRTPIACALRWPDRLPWNAPTLDLARIGTLTFEDPDLQRFPMLRLARQALSAGGYAPAVFSAANEEAVKAFLDRRIGFLDIATVVEETLSRMAGAWTGNAGDNRAPLDAALDWDMRARTEACGRIGALSVSRL